MLHVFQSLTEFIRSHSAPCFLLDEVVKRLAGKISEGCQVSISDYEFYLKYLSGLSLQEQREVRNKIMGRSAPKEFAQLIFPVAAGGQLPGSLVVTAHMSPDIDTVVTSFNGWMDAFEMDVCTGLHRWNVPNDPKEILEVKLLFLDRFGPDFFAVLSDNRTQLTMTALDLATTAGVKIHKLEDRTLEVSLEGKQHAVCVLDDNGDLSGVWLAEDVERVRLVIDGLNHSIRWAQNAFFQAMVSKESNANKLLDTLFKELEPVVEFSPRQKEYLDLFLDAVLGVHGGLKATLRHFMESLDSRYKFGFLPFLEALKRHKRGDIEDLEGLFNLLSNAFKKLRHHVDTFQVALEVKEKVLQDHPIFVHPHTTIEEIQLRIQERSAIFVVRDKKLEGVIYASKLRHAVQGFVCLRDFSNPNEIGIPRYMEIAAVLDHHKCEIKTQRVITIHTMDVQSSNVIGAKIAFDINKQLVTNSLIDEELDRKLLVDANHLKEGEHLRVMERALEEKIARKMDWGWCDVKRESTDYQMFLYAILDDTDLLSKKTAIDHEIVVELVNRLVSLEKNAIVEVIDPTSSKPLIQSPELYRYYKTVYALKEEDVEKRLSSFKIFSDTKKQANALVSQIKIYPNNVGTFQRHYKKLAETWREHPTELPLKIMMVTTVEGAEDLFKGIKPKHVHQDEMWLFADLSDEGISQLAYFLTTFLALHLKKKIEAFVPKEFKKICEEVMEIPFIEHASPWITFKFEAGAITSRKKDIAPCLKQ
ncbi:MAG: CBS domain-containing protein [Chlamydiia bacterium]